MNTESQQEKRSQQERDAIDMAPVAPEHMAAVTKAALLRASWATRQRNPRVCDVCGSEDHHGQL